MNFETQLKEYILLKYNTLANFCEKADISASTLSMIFKRGIDKCSIQNIFKICDELEISADALGAGKIIPREDYDKKDIELSQLIRLLDYSYCIKIDKETLSDEEMETLKNNLELTIEILKKKRADKK